MKNKSVKGFTVTNQMALSAWSRWHNQMALSALPPILPPNRTNSILEIRNHWMHQVCSKFTLSLIIYLYFMFFAQRLKWNGNGVIEMANELLLIDNDIQSQVRDTPSVLLYYVWLQSDAESQAVIPIVDVLQKMPLNVLLPEFYVLVDQHLSEEYLNSKQLLIYNDSMPAQSKVLAAASNNMVRFVCSSGFGEAVEAYGTGSNKGLGVFDVAGILVSYLTNDTILRCCDYWIMNALDNELYVPTKWLLGDGLHSSENVTYCLGINTFDANNNVIDTTIDKHIMINFVLSFLFDIFRPINSHKTWARTEDDPDDNDNDELGAKKGLVAMAFDFNGRGGWLFNFRDESNCDYYGSPSFRRFFELTQNSCGNSCGNTRDKRLEIVDVLQHYGICELDIHGPNSVKSIDVLIKQGKRILSSALLDQ